MQYISILFCLAVTATALPAVQSAQDLPTVKGAADAIAAALTTFDKAVVALGPTSDPATAVADLTAKQEAVLAALKDSTAKLTATTPITLTEAVQLQVATNALSQAANTTINDVIAKKPIFDKAGQSAKVLKNMEDQLVATKAFSTALVAKLPAAVASLGNAQAKVATDAISRGIAAYGGKARRQVIVEIDENEEEDSEVSKRQATPTPAAEDDEDNSEDNSESS